MFQGTLNVFLTVELFKRSFSNLVITDKYLNHILNLLETFNIFVL